MNTRQRAGKGTLAAKSFVCATRASNLHQRLGNATCAIKTIAMIATTMSMPPKAERGMFGCRFREHHPKVNAEKGLFRLPCPKMKEGPTKATRKAMMFMLRRTSRRAIAGRGSRPVPASLNHHCHHHQLVAVAAAAAKPRWLPILQHNESWIVNENDGSFDDRKRTWPKRFERGLLIR